MTVVTGENTATIAPFPGNGPGFTTVTDVDGRPCVVLRHVCDELGISVSSQIRRLSHEPWAHLGEIDTFGADGSRRRMAVLAMDAVPMWLATVRVSRVSPEAKEKLLAFQQLAAEALCERIHHGSPMPGVQTLPGGSGELDILEGMIGVLRGQTEKVNRIEILAREAVETERLNAARLAALEGAHEPGRLAALAYAALHGMPTDVDTCRRLGVTAGKIGRSLGLAVRTIPHPVYHTQNTWPDHVWDAAAAALGLQAVR